MTKKREAYCNNVSVDNIKKIHVIKLVVMFITMIEISVGSDKNDSSISLTC